MFIHATLPLRRVFEYLYPLWGKCSGCHCYKPTRGQQPQGSGFQYICADCDHKDLFG
jgi:hypothetical protein